MQPLESTDFGCKIAQDILVWDLWSAYCAFVLVFRVVLVTS